jgi:murein DD-endopeptidase MepM/ murein hydrolase activator NlpD
MVAVSVFGKDGLVSAVRRFFRPRDIFLHDGTAMRRLHLSTRVQAGTASGLAASAILSLFATLQIAGATAAIGGAIERGMQVARMQGEVASMHSDIAKLKAEAQAHAARIEARQAFLAAVLTGSGNPVLPADAIKTSAAAAPIIAPYAKLEGQQTAMAAQARALLERRYAETADSIRKLGVAPEMVEGGMGGPYEPVETTAATTAAAVSARPDPTFRALFQSWKRLDQLQQGAIAIPSQRPVDVMELTSGFGVRRDPFRGGAAMHAGVDIPGPYGSTIYATADGVVVRSERSGGYGNLVELDHGRGIQTRYGHLSASLVTPGQRVKRGDAIARMGSTGRSTGTHLHYEVRLDGHAVNPMPFLQSANYLAAMQARQPAKTAMGGPDQ